MCTGAGDSSVESIADAPLSGAVAASPRGATGVGELMVNTGAPRGGVALLMVNTGAPRGGVAAASPRRATGVCGPHKKSLAALPALLALLGEASSPASAIVMCRLGGVR